MDQPRDRKELETVLVIINYLAKFSPNLSEITHQMQQLLHNTPEFIWDKPQASAFQKANDILIRYPSPGLAYYDPKKPVTLQVDTPKYGPDVVLQPDSSPVAYASKTLTSSETNYAQIKKLAIMFGCKPFHHVFTADA